MRKYRDFRNNFEAGVVSKEFLARSGDELTRQAMQEGLNAFVTSAGTVMRRPGTARLFRSPNEGRTEEFEIADGTIRHLVFFAGGVSVYTDAGALQQTITGAPWGTAELFSMSVVNDDNRLFVFSTAFHPRTLTRASNGTWSLSLFEFRTDDVGRKLAPFYRFKLPGVTLRPSNYTGTVSIQFSDDVLTSGHVGVRFRYMRCQLVVTSVTDARNGVATVIDRLYPTIRVGVADASAFKVGEDVKGDVTNVRGQVVGTVGANVDIALTDGYSSFLAKAGDAPGEKLIGPQGTQEVLSTTSLSAPAATNIWHEELISAARGYPGAAALHRTRLCIAGFPQAGNLFVASALGAVDDFDVGAGSDADAIAEYIGEDPNAQIRHLVSTEQLILLTDRGAWYVPEGGNRQFTPQGVGFDPIAPDPCSDVPPAYLPEGVAFIDREGRCLLLSVTGTQRGAYSVTDISTLGHHLIRSPKQLVYSSGIGGRKERVIAVLNGDGTAAAFTYRRGGDQGGWTPWARRGNDRFLSFSSFNGNLYALAETAGFRTFERFTFDAVLDSEFLPSSTAYPNETVHMLLGGHVAGTNSTNGSGVLGSIGTLDHVDRLGQDFEVRIAPAPNVIGQAGRQRRRIARAYIDVIDSGQFRANGKLLQPYVYSSDPEAPPPVSDREFRASQIGSSYDRTMLIEQRDGEGAPLHVRGITMEVAAR